MEQMNGTPAPKVEKISLSELRAESKKVFASENKFQAEQKKLLEEQKAKKQAEMAKIKQEAKEFIDDVVALTPEQQDELIRRLKEEIE